MIRNRGPAPGYRRYPDHRIAVRRGAARYTVQLDGILLAQSEKVLVVEESGYGEVVYFPPQDVNLDRLSETDSRTTCPFKGEAGYFSVAGAKSDIAWRYPATYDEMSDIAGYIAFYADRIQLTDIQLTGTKRWQE